MPDVRNHRGPHPDDKRLFTDSQIGQLRSAVADFSLLLTKDYAAKSALKLVGDKYLLTERQRIAVMRSACSERQLSSRLERQVGVDELAGQAIAIDGYNVLITIEAAISDAIMLKGRDGSFRDLASIHGTYRKVEETIPAVKLIGRFLEQKRICSAFWLLDSPVSNSGRLKALIAELAEENNWQWDIKLMINPDAELIKTDMAVATSDSVVLDGCKRWVNLTRTIIEENMSRYWLVDLG